MIPWEANKHRQRSGSSRTLQFMLLNPDWIPPCLSKAQNKRKALTSNRVRRWHRGPALILREVLQGFSDSISCDLVGTPISFTGDSLTVKDHDVPDDFFRTSFNGDWWTSVCTLRAGLLAPAVGSLCLWPGRRGTCLFITCVSLPTPGIP